MLSIQERNVWVRFVQRETRGDSNGRDAAKHLEALMDTVHDDPTSDGWCGCPTHASILAGVLRIIWREPPA